MRVANAFLANHAEVRDGIANILGGFPEWYTVPVLPQQVLIFVVIDIVLEDNELGETFAINLILERPDHTTLSLGNIQMRRDRVPMDLSEALHHNIAVFPAPIILGGEGQHVITVETADGEQRIRIPIYARTAPTP